MTAEKDNSEQRQRPGTFRGINPAGQVLDTVGKHSMAPAELRFTIGAGGISYFVLCVRDF